MAGAARSTLKGDALNTRDLLVAGMSYMAPGFSFFFTTALIVSAGGAQAPLAYLLAGIGVLAAGASFAEFSRHAPSAGSLQVFVSRGFGPTAGSAAGLVLMGGYICLQAGVLALFGGWTSHLLQLWLSVQIPWPILSMLGLLVTTALMVRGVGLSIRATIGLFLIEFVLTGGLVLIVLARGGQSGLSATPINPFQLSLGWHGIALAMVFCVFSFVGFEGSISFAEETPHPRRAVPIAVIGGVIVMGLLYVVGTYSAIVGFGVNNASAIASDSAPVATLATRFAPWILPFLEFAVFTSITANLMAAGNANARILFNLGREGIVTRRLAIIHSQFRTPIVAIVVFMGSTAVLCLAGAVRWDYLTTFGNIAGLGSVLAILIYMTATAALPFYMRRQRAPLHWRRHLAIPIIGAGVWLVPVWGTLLPGQPFPANLYPWIALAVVILATAYALLRRGRLEIASPAEVVVAGESATPVQLPTRPA